MKKILKTSTFSINIISVEGKTMLHVQSQDKILQSVQNTLIRDISGADKTNDVLAEIAVSLSRIVKEAKR